MTGKLKLSGRVGDGSQQTIYQRYI